MKFFSTGPLENVYGTLQIITLFVRNESKHIENFSFELLKLINAEATSLELFYNSCLDTGLFFFFIIIGVNTSEYDGWEFQFGIDENSNILSNTWLVDENFNSFPSQRVLNSELTQIKKFLFPLHCLNKSSVTSIDTKKSNTELLINKHSDVEISIWEKGEDGKFIPSYRYSNNKFTNIEKLLFPHYFSTESSSTNTNNDKEDK